MKFKKINHNTIRCVLSQEDMEENDIGLEDFFTNNREKIQRLLENIMEEAKREIGYESDGAVVSMQLMPLPNNKLAITISGTQEKDFNEMLGNVKDMIQNMQNELVGRDGVQQDITSDNSAEVLEIPSQSSSIYCFQNLERTMHFCEEAQSFSKNINSALYRDADGVYYMLIAKGRGSYMNYDRVCMVANEFGEIVGESQLFAAHMEEHFEKMIAKKAIEQLSTL